MGRTVTWRRRENLLILVFALGIFEGAARKWFLPQGTPSLGYVAYLSKDLVFFALVALNAAVFTGAIARRTRRTVGSALMVIGLGIFTSSMYGVNLVGAFLDGRSMIVLPFLAALAGPVLIGVNVLRIARMVALLALVPALLGIVQFSLAPTHTLNTYVNPLTPVITFSGYVRATGTFSFISGMSLMTILAVWAGLFLLVVSQTKKDRLIGLIGIAAGLVCSATSISRSGMFLAIGMIAITFLLMRGKNKMLIPLIVLVLASTMGSPTERTESIHSGYERIPSIVFQRHERSDSVMDRVSRRLGSFYEALTETPLGYGFGFGQVGGAALTTGKRQFLRHESEHARMISEVGLIGYFGALMLTVSVLLLLFREWDRTPSGSGRNGTLVFLVGVGAFFLSNMFFNHVASGFGWPLVALAIVWMDQQRIREEWRKEESARPRETAR